MGEDIVVVHVTNSQAAQMDLKCILGVGGTLAWCGTGCRV